MDLDIFFCLRSNLGNGNIISAHGPGPKTGMDFRGVVWKRVWKIAVFGLKWGQDLENRVAHPHYEFPGIPPPLSLSLCLSAPFTHLRGFVVNTYVLESSGCDLSRKCASQHM